MAINTEWLHNSPAVGGISGIGFHTDFDAGNTAAVYSSEIPVNVAGKTIRVYALEQSGAGFSANGSLALQGLYNAAGTLTWRDEVVLAAASMFGAIQIYTVDLSLYPAMDYRFRVTTAADESALDFLIYIVIPR